VSIAVVGSASERLVRSAIEMNKYRPIKIFVFITHLNPPFGFVACSAVCSQPLFLSVLD